MLYPGQTLILTGASQGIGRALALRLAGCGLNLVLNARGVGPLQEVAQECRAVGQWAKVAALAGNVAQEEVAASLVRMAQDMGDFLGFIHAAGVLHPGPYLWEATAAQQAEVLDSILLGSLSLIRQALPVLLQGTQGLAVFFGSESMEQHTAGLGLYSLANASLEFLVRQLAAETQVVTPILFCSGAVDTRLQGHGRQAQGGAGQALRAIFQGYHDRGWLASPEQAAEALITVLDGQWRWLHGQVVNARSILGNVIRRRHAGQSSVVQVSFPRSLD